MPNLNFMNRHYMSWKLDQQQKKADSHREKLITFMFLATALGVILATGFQAQI